MSTVKQLVARVHYAVTTQENPMDLSPSDVGKIIGLFIDGLVGDPAYAAANEALMAIADECHGVRDE
jgi:hypothetical protein